MFAYKGHRFPAQLSRRLQLFLMIVPPVTFLLYVGHSLYTIGNLMSASFSFHLDYAESLIQDYLEMELKLEAERIAHCLAEERDNCDQSTWITTRETSTRVTAVHVAGEQVQLYLKKGQDLQNLLVAFIQRQKGLHALVEKRGHDAVYWFRILSPEQQVVYASDTEPKQIKARAQYPMTRSLKGYTLDIVYNSFGARQLYSVARNKINFGAIFLLFILVLFSILLATRTIRQKLRLAKQKTFFVSTVSHEFKTPLTIMRLASETLTEKRYRGEEEAKRFHRMLNNEINRLDHLVHKILNYSDMETGRLKFQPTTIQLEELLQPSIEAFQLQANTEKVTFKIEPAREPCPVECDPALLRQAIDNILDNAFKYRGNSDLIEMRWQRQTHRVVLEIRDHGIGMDREELKRIFKSFYRIEDPKTAGIRGSGLGLAIASYILSRSKVEIAIDSAPGEGTCFRLTFDVTAAKGLG